MKWITTDYKGDRVEWYSADVINRIREWATGEVLAKKCGMVHRGDACETIIKYLNKVDK